MRGPRFVMLGAMHLPHLRPRGIVALVLAALLSIVLSACGGNDSSSDRPQSQPVKGGTALAALWPLTGLPAPSTTPHRPVLVTKIDNTANSRPQLGLRRADLITEELVEGGMTRLAVFFYSHLPSVAGPVRSMRASDIGIVKPAHGVIVASGAAPPTIKRLKDVGVTFFTEGGPGYFRSSNRTAPYNLFVNMSKLASAVRNKAIVPASYLPWGKGSDFTGTQKAGHINAVFSRSHTTTWDYHGGKYHNTNSNAAADAQFVPDSVLVLRVREGDAGYLDPAGNRVPETIYSGTGPAMLFHDGKVVRGTWKKRSKRTPVKLSTRGGTLRVPAGHVWIELVPRDRDGGRVAAGK